MGVVSLGSSNGSTISLANYATLTTNTFTGTQNFNGTNNYSGVQNITPASDQSAIILRSYPLQTSELLSVRPPGSLDPAYYTKLLATGSLVVIPFANAPGYSVGSIISAPYTAIYNSGNPLAAGATTIPLYAPVTNGIYVIDTGATAENVTVTGCAGTSRPFIATVSSATTKSHNHGATFGPQNTYALQLMPNTVSGGSLIWQDASGATQGRFNGTGAINVYTSLSSFGTSANVSNTTLSTFATSTGTTPFAAKRIAGQTVDMLWILDENNNKLAYFDKVGHFVAGTQVPPAITAGAQASAASIAASASDQAGSYSVTSSASPVAGILATITFGTAFPATPKAVIVGATNAASAGLGLYVSAKSSSAITISCINAPAASTTLTFDVSVVG